MTAPRRRPARERLLNAADDLMFVDGVVLTPVDVILRRAGASPATLYANFGNKDGLVAAALERRLQEWTRAWDRAIADADSPGGRLLSIFPALSSYQHERLNERWCAFSGTTAATNRPSEAVTAVLRAEDEVLRTRLLTYASELVGRERGQALADQVLVAYFGALTGMLRGDQDRAIRQSHEVARTLVALAVGE